MAPGATAQFAGPQSSAKILQQLHGLKVMGSVLYIAAHPDDENTRLLSYLANERLVRTGYLSLTRGDGGQNLIGKEQGVSLGLIRTQELISARKVDGAEQYFSTAYDFGFSKSPEEAFRIWGKEKVLGDVVWIIRTFKPDVIIARFPGDERAGHGHHAASGILAREAFAAAADPTQFPDQLKKGATVWQAKRVLWNTFNFGGRNTIQEGQFRIDVGGYNTLLGESNGEIAANSRSQHKSQGFGVPSSRGQAFEYFEQWGGEPPVDDLFDGVDLSLKRVGLSVDHKVDSLVRTFNPMNPALTVKGLMELQNSILNQPSKLDNDPVAGYLIGKKMEDISTLIGSCLGLHFEAIASSEFAVSGDSLKIRMSLINRSDINISRAEVQFQDSVYRFDSALVKNIPVLKEINTLFVKKPLDDQPYWLVEPMNEGGFNVRNQANVGLPENEKKDFSLRVMVNDRMYTFVYPLQYKFTDPVKGEVYKPVIAVPALFVSLSPQVVLNNVIPRKVPMVQVNVVPNKNMAAQNSTISFNNGKGNSVINIGDTTFTRSKVYSRYISVDSLVSNKQNLDIGASVILTSEEKKQQFSNDVHIIQYDHIPTVHYLSQSKVKVIQDEVRTKGKRVGYIRGAGDNVSEALIAMGYEVLYLEEPDITPAKLKSLDAIITGVRAYNVHNYLSDKYETLMDYVRNGGNLIVQYNTNSMVGPIRARIAPYPFTISRTRITDESSPVDFAIPSHPVLNFPNKITKNDFQNWVQERGIYFAEGVDPKYVSPLLMNDPGEKQSSGSLVIADYGKGKFVYTGIVFFRQLPAGVTGAYRLLANIIALNQKK